MKSFCCPIPQFPGNTNNWRITIPTCNSFGSNRLSCLPGVWYLLLHIYCYFQGKTFYSSQFPVYIAQIFHFPRNDTNNRGIAIPTCNSFGSNSAVAFLLEASAFDMFHPSNHACLAEAHCEPLLRISFGNLCTFDYLHREKSCSSNKSLDGISI